MFTLNRLPHNKRSECPFYNPPCGELAPSVNPPSSSALFASLLLLRLVAVAVTLEFEEAHELGGRGCYLFKLYFLLKDGSTFGRRKTFFTLEPLTTSIGFLECAPPRPSLLPAFIAAAVKTREWQL